MDDEGRPAGRVGTASPASPEAETVRVPLAGAAQEAAAELFGEVAGVAATAKRVADRSGDRGGGGRGGGGTRRSGGGNDVLEFRAMGLLVGSGMVESACGIFVGERRARRAFSARLEDDQRHPADGCACMPAS